MFIVSVTTKLSVCLSTEIDFIVSRVAMVLENPRKSWNWGKTIPGPGKSLNLGRGP